MAQVLAMFPGQGSQFVGMGKDLLAEFPATRAVFEEAEDAARVAVRRLCFDGPDEELKLTANTQPCILTVSVAMWRVLKAETGFTPAYYAGHSLGEYAALVAAGRLAFGRAVALVRQRGEEMQRAVPPGVGAMAAVLNVAAEDLTARCAKLSVKGHVVEVVNFNSPQQLVVAGHQKAVDALCAGLEADKLRFVVLPVSAPFHSSLMQPALEAMTGMLEATTFVANGTAMIPNLTGAVTTDYSAAMLIKQIAAPVLWTQSLAAAVESGCDTYIEIGPGKVLNGLARRSLPKTAKLLHSEDIKALITSLRPA